MRTELVPLREVATIIAGQSPPSNTYNENGVGLPFFQGKADFGETHPIARKWCLAPKKVAETGDILISVRAPVGPTNIARERCCIGRGLAAIRPDETVALRDYVLWSINYRQPELVAKGQGSTFAAIGQKDLKSLLIPVPPLDEQRRIVGILNRAARIERLRKRAQERLREFIPALYVEMCGDPVENPMGWPIYKLQELSTLGPQYGANARAAPFSTDQPRYIRITDIQEFGALSNEPVGVECGNHERYFLREGDLLFARSGATVGKTYLYRSKDGPCVFAGYLIRFRLDQSKILPEVMFAFTQSSAYASWIESKRRTAAQPNINGQEYRALTIPVPSLDVQRRFVNLAKSTQAAVERMQLGGRGAAALSASLMSRLLGNDA